MIVVVMGVSGSGKTTVGRRLAEALAVDFIEGDTFHPPANVEKMRRGTPLDDADRRPWLETLAREIAARPGGVVLACSALKRAYRELLRGGRADVVFVHLDGPIALIRDRLEARRGHYMPAALLASQLDVLEPPEPDEAALRIDVSAPPEEIVARVLRHLDTRGAA